MGDRSPLAHRLSVCLAIGALAACGTVVAAERGDGRQYDAEIAALAAHPAVKRALEMIPSLESASFERLIELSEIPAPPFAEAPRAERYAAMVRGLGLEEVQLDQEGNVLARWRGSDPSHTVAIVAHLDTVFPAGTDVSVQRSGTHFSGPGVGDNARGLVMLLTLMEAMRSSGIQTKGDVLFVGSVGEEGVGDLRGVKHLFREGGPRIDEFIAIDGGNDERVLNRAVGSNRYRITVNGPGGHSWGAFGMANPAHALATAIDEFERKARKLVRRGARTTYNIGRLGGGTSVNAVPFEAWAEVDLRSIDPRRLAEIDSLLHSSVDQALAQHNGQRSLGDELTAELAVIGQRPSGSVDPATPIIQRAFAIARYHGIRPELGSGSTDANVPIARGVPATTISRGGISGGAHSLNEWWSAENAAVGTSKALLLLLASAGVD